MSANFIVSSVFILFGAIVILLPKKYHIYIHKILGMLHPAYGPFKEDSYKHNLTINSGLAFVIIGIVIAIITFLVRSS